MNKDFLETAKCSRCAHVAAVKIHKFYIEMKEPGVKTALKFECGVKAVRKTPNTVIFKRIRVLCFYLLVHSMLPEDLICFSLRPTMCCRQDWCNYFMIKNWVISSAAVPWCTGNQDSKIWCEPSNKNILSLGRPLTM